MKDFIFLFFFNCSKKYMLLTPNPQRCIKKMLNKTALQRGPRRPALGSHYSNSQMDLAHAGSAYGNDIFPVVNEGKIQQPGYLLFGDGGLEAVIKLFQLFQDRKSGPFHVLQYTLLIP